MGTYDPNSFVTSNVKPSIRALLTERRTYLRPLDDEEKLFETPEQALDRVMGHQRYLWENAQGRPLDLTQEAELAELRWLIEQRKVSMSGRVKWMGGTDIIKERASAAFNCSFTEVGTPADLTDVFWLLLQGCGVGFKPKPGLLTGLPSSIVSVETVPSHRLDKGGAEHTVSRVEGDVWTITFGDSAKGWAKALGKLTTEKPRVKTLRLVYSELRPGGKRLKGYGWLSSGWEPLAKGMNGIVEVLRRRGDNLLNAIDIGDIVNWLGTVLSSRRSAQIWVLDEHSPDYVEFVDAKTDRWKKGLGHREQSNNSILFHKKPSKSTIKDLLTRILTTGEPGFVNLKEGRRRAPEMEGLNPCAEILLPSKGFCNLVQVVFHRFNGDQRGLLRALWIAARANYRQTCVSMKDGVLQLQWNDNQRLLRLCGVSPTGTVSWVGVNDPDMIAETKRAAVEGANSMADELGSQRPRRVTQVQPAGTVSKVMGLEGDEVHEGLHVAMSRWIFNWINFSIFDPLVETLRQANYKVLPNPVDPTGMIVAFPVEYPSSDLFTRIEHNGEVMEINRESAISQLNRYKMWMENYAQHNCSITVSFDEDEIDAMADWFMENWDSYVGVSFLKRNDPLKTAEELGFSYLPQECVSEAKYRAYVEQLLPVDLAADKGEDMIDNGCATGACPIR